MEKKFDIFISYRRNGGETTAVLLKSELSHLGYRVFLDFDDLPIGGNFEERICQVIKSSHLFLFLYSYGSLNRCKDENDTLRKEIECAIKNNIQILTLNVNLASKYYNFPPKQAKLPPAIIEALGRHNFLDFFSGQYKQDSLNRLAEFMATQLGKHSLGFQKKKCTVALLSEVDATLKIGKREKPDKLEEWTVIRANNIKHVQIDYGEWHVVVEPSDEYYKPVDKGTVIFATPMKEIQLTIEELSVQENAQDEDLPLAFEAMSPEDIREEGWKYQLIDKPRLAIKCWTIAAELGDAAAQYSLGYNYSKGEYLPHDDVKAFEWYDKAARQGDSRSQFLLGDAFYYGSGTKRDFKQAIYWYKKAAEQGNGKGIYSLACCYQKGHGVDRDPQKAFKLYLQSAETGYHNAQIAVARCYEAGKDAGVSQDLEKALEWYQKAAQQDSQTAKLYCERIEKILKKK